MPYGTDARLTTPLADLNVEEAPQQTNNHPGIPLGFKVSDDQGREYMRVKFGGAVNQYDAVYPTAAADPYSSVVVVTDVDKAFMGVYFNSVAAASGDYGWIMTRGKTIVKTSGVSAGDFLGASATDGTMTTLAVTGGGITAGEATRIRAATFKGAIALTATNTPSTGTSYALMN